MSLLKWKELERTKSKLGNKINYINYAITQSNVGKQTSRESFKKVFEPITTKFDDVITSNLKQRPLKRRQKRTKVFQITVLILTT